jgi:hypothetical protein
MNLILPIFREIGETVLFVNIVSTFSQFKFSICTFTIHTGLPDGLFSIQKSQFWEIFHGLRLKNIDIFYGRLSCFTDKWVIL